MGLWTLYKIICGLNDVKALRLRTAENWMYYETYIALVLRTFKTQYCVLNLKMALNFRHILYILLILKTCENFK